LTQERKHLESVPPCKLMSNQIVRLAAHLTGRSGVPFILCAFSFEL